MRLFRLREKGIGGRSIHATLGAYVLVLVLSLVARDALAQLVEFTAHATLLHTGNSLSLSGQSNANGPGTAHSGHTLISLDPTAVDDVPSNAANPWFAGTTANYLLDGSAAVLHVPAQSNILHAELIWGGSYNYIDNLTSALDQAVTFQTPAGASVAITPDPSWSDTLSQTSGGAFIINYYIRAADVTALVALGGDGTYKVRGVPVTQNETINSLNSGGWALVVVAENAQAPCRSIALRSVGGWVDENYTATAPFSNLSTPASGAITGRAVVGAIGGDATVVGDSVLIQVPETLNYLQLSGPNNPLDNFFGSQINDSNGLLDTSGTFGTRNHNAVAMTQSIGARQGLDLTAIALDSASGELAPAQVATALRFYTTGDGYLPMFAGIEVDTASHCAAPPGDGIFLDGFESAVP